MGREDGADIASEIEHAYTKCGGLAQRFAVRELEVSHGLVVSENAERTCRRTDMWTDNRTDGRADKPDNFFAASEFATQAGY